jgi:hypothetical protein
MPIGSRGSFRSKRKAAAGGSPKVSTGYHQLASGPQAHVTAIVL